MKKRFIYFLLLTFSSFFACNISSEEGNTNSGDVIEKNIVPNEVIPTEGVSSSINLDSSGFIQKNPFTISNIQQPNDSNSSMGDISICNEFKLLTKEEITSIIQSVTPMSGVEWHHLFDHLPCNITSKIQQGKQTYDLDINSGGWLNISSADTSYIYGNFNKNFDKYFMSGPMTEEEIHGE